MKKKYYHEIINQYQIINQYITINICRPIFVDFEFDNLPWQLLRCFVRWIEPHVLVCFHIVWYAWLSEL